MSKLILDLCAGSGEWSKPYAEAGYDVERVELKTGGDVRLWPSAPSSEPRLPRDFASIEGRQVHGILAAPDCRVFAGSGARWPRSDDELREGLALVDACLRIVYATDPQWWVLENPVGKLSKWIGEPVMRFNPCDYGDPWTKRTLLWGKFTEPIKTPVEPAPGGFPGWRMLGGRSERTKAARSVTPAGFARAFFRANQ